MTIPHDHDRTNCLLMFAKLSEYIDNELDESTSKEIEDHAGQCIPCKACLETLRRTIGLSRSLASEDIPVPETFSERLKALIQKMSREK
jgi:anti-sigma factor RsiW